MKLIRTLVSISLFSLPALAGSIQSAKIETLMLDRNKTGKVFIRFDKTHTNKINCHANSWEYGLGITDDFGKTLYVSLLANYAAGKVLNFDGTGTCSQYPNIETLRRIELI